VSTRNTSTARTDATVNHARSAPPTKDRRRWCRGKAGIQHVVVMVYRPYYGHTCRIFEYTVRRPGGRDKHVKRWTCSHQWACDNCGKVLDRVSRDDCPAYQALPREEQWASS